MILIYRIIKDKINIFGRCNDMKKLCFSLFFFLLLGMSMDAFAGGYSITYFGIRRAAMGVAVAGSDDPTAIYHNPACLADLKGMQTYLDALASINDVEFRFYLEPDPNHPDYMDYVNPPPGTLTQDEVEEREYWQARLQKDTTRGVYPSYDQDPLTPENVIGASPTLGITYNFKKVSNLLSGLTIGLGIYFPAALGASMGDDNPARYFLTDGYFIAGSMTLSLGYRFFEYIAIGAGISLMYMTLELNYVLNLDQMMGGPRTASDILFNETNAGPEWKNNPANYLLSAGGDAWTFGYNFGLLISPHPQVDIGLVFISRSSAELSGDLTLRNVVSGGTYLGQDLDITTNQSTKYTIPESVKVGINIRVTDWWEIGLDYYFFHYEIIEYEETKIDLNPLPVLQQNIFKLVLDDLGGGKYGLANPRNYNNSHSISGGMLFKIILEEWEVPAVHSLEFMTGVTYDWAPYINETYSIFSLGLNTFGYSWGFRWRIIEELAISMAASVWFYDDVNVTESVSSPPANVMVDVLMYELHAGINYQWDL